MLERAHFGQARRWAPQIALVVIALVTRLTLMSRSLDEVDVANFVNGLTNGFDIPALRPHPPGFPIYMLAGLAIDKFVQNPLLSLTTLSAVSGSLAVFPFYSILRRLVGPTWSVWACLCLILNPLYWAFSESALSDVPSAAIVVALAYTSLRAPSSRPHLYASAALASLALGVRLGNIPLLCLPGLSLAHVLIRGRRSGLPTLDMWLRIFGAVTGLWLVYMVFWGSPGTADYLAAFQKQWATAVTVYDIRSVAEPRLVNGLIRIERFFVGYYFTYPWLGLDERSRFAAWLSMPWIAGFCLFVMAFRANDLRHQLLVLWVLSIVYTAVTIHFLPRYGLPHLPGFIACSVVGISFLVRDWGRLKRAPESVLLVALAMTLLLYAIKVQPPIATFEMSPPAGSMPGAALFVLGLMSAFAARWALTRAGPSQEPSRHSAGRWVGIAGRTAGAGWIMAPVVMVLAFVGFSRVTVMHGSTSPTQQLVEYVRDHFDVERLVICWDPNTHSSFELLIPGTAPVGYQSLDELRASITGDKTLVATDHCIRYGEVSRIVELRLIATFGGDSPAWSKSPVIRLYGSASDPGVALRGGPD